jgi:hypothetical protein
MGGIDLRVTQVGVGKVGTSEVDEGVAPAAVGREPRATQVGVGEIGSVKLDRARSYERGISEVAVR